MNCSEIRKLLSDYMDKELSRGAAESVRLHLLKCANCSAALKQMEGNSAALANLADEEVPEEFYRGLDEKLDGASLPVVKWLGQFLTFRNGAALVSGVLIGLVAGGVIFRAGTPGTEKFSVTKVVIHAGEMAKAGLKIEQMRRKYDAAAVAETGGSAQSNSTGIMPKRYVVVLNPNRMDMFMDDLKSVGAVRNVSPYGMKAGYSSGVNSARIEFELEEETQPAGNHADGAVPGGK